MFVSFSQSLTMKENFTLGRSAGERWLLGHDLAIVSVDGLLVTIP